MLDGERRTRSHGDVVFRLLKAAVTLAVLAVLAAGALAWFGLERTVRAVAVEAAEPFGDRLTWTRVSMRLLPPSAVLEGAQLRNPEGDLLIAAERVVLPLLPGAWTGASARTASPRLEEWTLFLDVPRTGAPNWAEAAASKLPRVEWWSGRDGAVELRFAGEGERVRFERVRLVRRRYSMVVEGHVADAPASSARFTGEWDPNGRVAPRFTLELKDLPAQPWSSWLLPAAEGRVRGGNLSVTGGITVPGDALVFEGSIATAGLLVEGTDATPGPFEAAIRRGRGDATFAVEVSGTRTAATDWASRMRGAVRASADGARPAGPLSAAKRR